MELLATIVIGALAFLGYFFKSSRKSEVGKKDDALQKKEEEIENSIKKIEEEQQKPVESISDDEIVEYWDEE